MERRLVITKFPGKVYFVFPNFDEKDRSGRRFFTAIMVSDCPGEKNIEIFNNSYCYYFNGVI